MTLTTRTQALIQPLNDALGSLNSLLGTSEFDPSQAHRRFRLSLSDYAARIILPPLVRYVRKWATGIDLAISQASRETVLPTKEELSLEQWLQRPHVMLALRPDANDKIEKNLSLLGLKRHIALALPHWNAAVELLPGTLGEKEDAAHRWLHQAILTVANPLKLCAGVSERSQQRGNLKDERYKLEPIKTK
ncbi:hypothetical protein [Xenorhabdus budapestensis]|uniref:hypothetical protein n=1 Tax=Xenorhabdus budapestensis TaxID=290110 RepID=UPI001FD2E679|nr:hypothetical protein [Xenorhabdus budapestensis]